MSKFLNGDIIVQENNYKTNYLYQVHSNDGAFYYVLPLFFDFKFESPFPAAMSKVDTECRLATEDEIKIAELLYG